MTDITVSKKDLNAVLAEQGNSVLSNLERATLTTLVEKPQEDFTLKEVASALAIDGFDEEDQNWLQELFPKTDKKALQFELSKPTPAPPSSVVHGKSATTSHGMPIFGIEIGTFSLQDKRPTPEEMLKLNIERAYDIPDGKNQGWLVVKSSELPKRASMQLRYVQGNALSEPKVEIELHTVGAEPKAKTLTLAPDIIQNLDPSFHFTTSTEENTVGQTLSPQLSQFLMFLIKSGIL